MSDVRQREIEESHWFRTPESGVVWQIQRRGHLSFSEETSVCESFSLEV